MMLVAFKLAFNYIYNEYIITKYNNDDYHISMQPIFSCNWVQSYLPHYNAGNVYYQNGDYELAIKEYEQALDRDTGKNHFCDIRVNIALAMIGTLPEEYGNEENVEKTIKVLTEARNILIQDGCAKENGDGHDEEATKLKKEIDDILNSLNNGGEPQPGGNSTEPQNGGKTEERKEEEIKKKLQEQQNNGFYERQHIEDFYEEFNQGMGDYFDKPVW